jgi:hypothetical protein
MDANGAARRAVIVADGQGAWSWPPDAEVKLCETFRNATGAIKPGTPGESAP